MIRWITTFRARTLDTINYIQKYRSPTKGDTQTRSRARVYKRYIGSHNLIKEFIRLCVLWPSLSQGQHCGGVSFLLRIESVVESSTVQQTRIIHSATCVFYLWVNQLRKDTAFMLRISFQARCIELPAVQLHLALDYLWKENKMNSLNNCNCESSSSGEGPSSDSGIAQRLKCLAQNRKSLETHTKLVTRTWPPHTVGRQHT